MKKSTYGFVFLSILFFTACTGKNAIEHLFKIYSLKPGFTLAVSESDLKIDFALDKEITLFINSVEKYYELTYDRDKGNPKTYKRFVEKLERIVKKGNFSPVLDLRMGGRFAAYYRKDDSNKITGFLLIKEGKSTSTWLWAPAGEDEKTD